MNNNEIKTSQKKDWTHHIEDIVNRYGYETILLIKSEELRGHLNGSDRMSNNNYQRLNIERQLRSQLKDILHPIMRSNEPFDKKQHYSNWIDRVTGQYRLFISCYPQKTIGNTPQNIEDISQELGCDIPTHALDNVCSFLIKSYLEKTYGVTVQYSSDIGNDSNKIDIKDANLMIQLIEKVSVNNAEVLASKQLDYDYFFLAENNLYPNKYLCFCLEEIDIPPVNGNYKTWLEELKQADISFILYDAYNYFQTKIISDIQVQIQEAIYPEYRPYSETTKSKIKLIKKFISETKIEDALKVLKEIADENIKNEVIMLEDNHRRNERDRFLERVKTEDYNVKSNKIRAAILDLLKYPKKIQPTTYSI